MVGVAIGVWIVEVPLVIGVTSIKSKPFHNKTISQKKEKKGTRGNWHT
jgi:hypothetical protein